MLGGTLILADQPSENRSAPDPLAGKVRRRMIGAWWEKAQRSVWPPSVVVGAVLSEDGPQVSFAEDQDAVGEFGSGGQHEAFGEAVRSRTSRRDFTASMPAPAKTASNELVNWPARSSRSTSRLRVCWVVHAPVGWLVVPRMCT